MIPLTTPINVSAGDGIVLTIVVTEDEGECTSISFQNPPGICPIVCLSEIEVFGTRTHTLTTSKTSKSKASKGAKAKVRKLNHV